MSSLEEDEGNLRGERENMKQLSGDPKGDWDELEGKYSPCEKEKGSCFQEKKAGLRREERGFARTIRPKHLHRLLVWNRKRNVTLKK